MPQTAGILHSGRDKRNYNPKRNNDPHPSPLRTGHAFAQRAWGKESVLPEG